MPVVYGQGSRKIGRGSHRSGACDSGGISGAVSAANVVHFKPSSEVLLRVSRSDSEFDPSVLLEAGEELGALIARCGAVLADGALAVAAAVWGTERLLGESTCVPRRVGGVRVVTGRRTMGRLLAQASSAAVRSRLSMSSLPYKPDAGRQTGDARLAAQGVRLRALYQRSVCGFASPVLSCVEVRTGDLVPMDMLVVDNEVAILPVDPDRPGIGLIVVTDPAWVRLARVVAESCWARAEGVGGGC